MLRNITAIIFAVITLVAFLAIFPTVITSVEAITAITNISTNFPAVVSIVNLIPLVAIVGKILPILLVIIGLYSLKFGETLASKVVGNPELSPKWSEKCTDLTGDNLKGLVKEKVGSVMKISGLNGSFSSSFNSLCSSKKEWFRKLNYMEYSKC